jgi:hypothetical protein
MDSLVELSIFFYQEGNPNYNHTVSISVTIALQENDLEVFLDDFKISLFHWPGSYYSQGYYYYYSIDPAGPNPYYHFTIYSDGLCEMKFAELSVRESKDYSSSKAQQLVNNLTSLNFFTLKDAYYTPSYSYFESSIYQICIDSKSTYEWRQSEEAYDFQSASFYLKPAVFAEMVDLILTDMNSLDFQPKRWPWRMIFWIAAGSTGGLSCLVMGVYFFVFRRKR